MNRDNDINVNFNGYNEVDMNSNIGMNSNSNIQAGYSQPLIEPMQERVVNRTILHDVNHICPIRTRIINNHVYRHTYTPTYSCCEENVVSNIDCKTRCN